MTPTLKVWAPQTLEKSAFQTKRSWRLSQGENIPMMPAGLPATEPCGMATLLACNLPLSGKTVGIAARMVSFSAGVSPPRLRLMRFPDQENEKSFTELLLKIVVNLATDI